MPPPLHIDPRTLNLDHVVADKEAILKINPQRYEMAQLDSIFLLDPDQQIIGGYKNVSQDEFWTRGHFPDFPLMPGVLMCEAAAQLASFYTVTQKIVEDTLIGFGGMDNVRFRGLVKPGQRLVLIGKGKRLRRMQTIFNVQGFVNNDLVFHGDLIGVPLPRPEGK